MKLLITGGTGLIGSAYIRQFHEQHQFTVLTRDPAGAAGSLPASVTLISTLSALPDLNAFDAVVNLAGEPIVGKRWSKKQKQRICDSRWKITEQLSDLFLRSETPPATFLSGSAIGVYGNRGDERLIDTATTPGDDFPSSLCLRWEDIASTATTVTRVVNLRTGIVLNPEGGALAKMLTPFRLGAGGRIGKGRQYMSWIHRDDYSRALQFLLDNSDLSGPINLTAPTPESNTAFTQTLAKTLNRPALLPMPAAAMKLALGDAACILLDSQRVIPQTLLDAGFLFHFDQLNAALTDLLKKP